MDKLSLNEVEKLRLNNSSLKLNNLQMQFQMEQMNYNNVLRDFCEKNGKSYNDIARVNPDSGLVEFKTAEPKAEAG